MAENDCQICHRIVSVVFSTESSSEESLGSGKTVLDRSTKCNIHQGIIASAINLRSLPNSLSQIELIEDIWNIRIVKIPNNAATILVTDRKSQDGEPRRAAFYPFKTNGDPPELVGARILDPKWIDINLPSFWEKSCSRLHGKSCGSFSIPTLSKVMPTLLVDVDNHCVVDNPGKTSYVALSYVWGNQQGLLATKANISKLLLPKSLAEPALWNSLPKTIQDAMGVVKLLGEKYLWVDTLCIIQDGQSHKRHELAKMGGIYANASVTIIAMQGTHANSGLRGLKGISEARSLRQVVHDMAGGTKILEFSAAGQLHDVGSFNPVWPTRAWTYQENIFSKRKLIFDGDSIRWECVHSVWREHIDGHGELLRLMDDIITCHSMIQTSVPAFAEYQILIQQYNRRQLTFPEDAANAFAGVSHCISAAVGGGLISGLPTTCFDIFLLWTPEERVTRRLPKNPNSVDSLPSWSWLGWSGGISVKIGAAEYFLKKIPSTRLYRAPRLDIHTSLVTWKYYEKQGVHGLPITGGVLDYWDSWQKNTFMPGSEWSIHDISESPELQDDLEHMNYTPTRFLKNSKYPGYEFRYPIHIPDPGSNPSVINPPFISCKTRRAYMFVGEAIKSFIGPPTFSLYDKAGQWSGVLEPLVKIAASGDRMEVRRDEPLELVELAKGCCSTTARNVGIREIETPEISNLKENGWYHFHWVMWIEWQAGIAYRRGIGRVCSTVWETQRMETINVMLG